MQSVDTNISAENVTRPFARLVASEFSGEPLNQGAIEKGCYLSSGTNPLDFRDIMDDGT